MGKYLMGEIQVKIYRSFQRKLRENKWVLWGFFLPFLLECIIVGAAFCIGHIGVTASDCFEQYVPFFSVYYEKLKEGGSLFYSWDGSMGFDFWNVFAYYLVSPLNLLMLLFPKSCIIYVVNFLILLKTALCGGTFSWYLQRKFPEQRDFSISLFGLLFAFCGFLLGYCWNVMWLDSVVLFPMLMAAMDDLIEKKKPNAYCLFLAAVIVLNYFMGYMICIYIFVSFFTYAFKGWKDFFGSLVRIGIYSLLGLGISAVILFPSFLGLTSTAISEEAIPGLEFYGSFGNVFATLGSFSIPVGISFDRERANLYMGEFGLLLAFLYLNCGAIGRREKLRKLFLLAFLLFSCNFRPLNFLWHGFHEQSGIPNRFSFIIIFLMLVMAYEAYVRRQEFLEKEIRRGFLCYGAFMLVLAFLAREVWYSFAAAIVIGFLYCRSFSRHRMESDYSWRIRLFLIGEASVMYVIAMFNCLGVFMADYGEQIDDFKELAAAKEEGAYREKMDQTTNLRELEWKEWVQNLEWEDISVDRLLSMYDLMKHMGHLSVMNEASVYGIHAMTLFNTFNNAGLSGFYEKTGGEGSSNYVGYVGENSFMDMILGVKYYYNRYHTVNSFAYEPVRTSGAVQLYENQYALSLAYAIPEKLQEEEDLLHSNPFETMNEISRDIVKQDVYSLRQFVLDEFSGCEKDQFNGTYGYFTDFVRGEAQTVFSYEAKAEENLILQVRSGEMYRTDIYVNESLVFSDSCHKQVIDLGVLKPKDQVKIVLFFSREYDKAGLYLYGAVLNQEVMKQVYDSLSSQQMNVTAFAEDSIGGTITITEESAPVLVTIPYKKGWTILADGEPVDAELQTLWGGAFPVVELSKGTHELVFSYVSPMFYPGLYVSFGSLLLFFVQWMAGVYCRSKK